MSRIGNFIVISLGLILLNGCAVKRSTYDVPELLLPEQFQHASAAERAERLLTEQGAEVEAADTEPSRSEEKAPAERLPEQPPDFVLPLEPELAQWWRHLAGDELDFLVRKALAESQDLRISTLRVTQTWQRLRQAHGAEWPVITAPFQARIESPDGDIGSVPPGGTPGTRHTYQASLRADWRVDLWGEMRSLRDGARFRMWQEIFRHDAVQMELVAEITAVYLEYLALNDRLRVARDGERVMDGMLEVVSRRLGGGDATRLDLEQQRAAVHEVKAVIPELELQREEARHRLARLIGTIPGELQLSDVGLDSLAFPKVVPGIPPALLLRRPDLREVEAELLAADADIDVARARILPPLDLTAQIGYGSRHLSQMFSPHTLFWQVIANLSATIFDGGRRRLERDIALARHEELVENYIRTTYNAVREVEDALVAIEHGSRRLAELSRAVESSRLAMEFSEESYRHGASDYLTMLFTIHALHKNLDRRLQVRLSRHQALVRLFRALGGGVPELLPLPRAGRRPSPLLDEDEGVLAILNNLTPRLIGNGSAELMPFQHKFAPEQSAPVEPVSGKEQTP